MLALHPLISKQAPPAAAVSTSVVVAVLAGATLATDSDRLRAVLRAFRRLRTSAGSRPQRPGCTTPRGRGRVLNRLICILGQSAQPPAVDARGIVLSGAGYPRRAASPFGARDPDRAAVAVSSRPVNRFLAGGETRRSPAGTAPDLSVPVGVPLLAQTLVVVPSPRGQLLLARAQGIECGVEDGLPVGRVAWDVRDRCDKCEDLFQAEVVAQFTGFVRCVCERAGSVHDSGEADDEYWAVGVGVFE
jgi:hypothetical protein